MDPSNSASEAQSSSSSPSSRRKPVPMFDPDYPFGSSSSSPRTPSSMNSFELGPPVPSSSYDPLGEVEVVMPPRPPRRKQSASSNAPVIPLEPVESNETDSLHSLEGIEPTIYRKDRKMSEVEWANILANRPNPLDRSNQDNIPRLESIDTLKFQRASMTSVRESDESSAPPLTPEPVRAPALAHTWDVAHEVDFIDNELVNVQKPTWANSAPGSPLRAFGKNGKKQKQPVEPFDVNHMPTKQRLWEAGTCMLRDEDGANVRFSELFTGPVGSRSKTVVFFIRHFWCGQCQDYMFASLSLLDPVAIAKSGINVVIISNGSWKIIKKYRKLFNCPFPVYVDGPRRLYQLMGMTKMTNDFGPAKDRAAYHQRAVPGQLVHGIGNALLKMPLADPGTLTQLGGEFVLGPGWNCSFAHRMTNTSDHMEAPDVLKRAGCEDPTYDEHARAQMEEARRKEITRLEKEMNDWKVGRETELERIRRSKAERRGEAYSSPPVEMTGRDARLQAFTINQAEEAELSRATV